jgi:hypothetical protein
MIEPSYLARNNKSTGDWVWLSSYILPQPTFDTNSALCDVDTNQSVQNIAIYFQ